MAVGKFVSKIVQSLPSWEVTKYYGRVAWFQLQCLKYRIQTSETWFNIMNKFMPGRLKNEAEYEENTSGVEKNKQVQGKKDESSAQKPKSTLLMEKLEKLRKKKDQKDQKDDSSRYNEEKGAIEKCIKSDKKKNRDENFEASEKAKK